MPPTTGDRELPPFDWDEAVEHLAAAGHPLDTAQGCFAEGCTATGHRYRLAVHDSAGGSYVVVEVTVWLYEPQDRRDRLVANPYKRPALRPPDWPERYHARFRSGGGEVFVARSLGLPATMPAVVAALDEVDAAGHAARARFTALHRSVAQRTDGQRADGQRADGQRAEP